MHGVGIQHSFLCAYCTWFIPHRHAIWDRQCFFVQTNLRCSVGWTHSGSLYLAFWSLYSVHCLPIYRGVFQVAHLRQKDLGYSGSYETRSWWSASHLEATRKPYLGVRLWLRRCVTKRRTLASRFLWTKRFHQRRRPYHRYHRLGVSHGQAGCIGRSLSVLDSLWWNSWPSVRW